jgi:parallel beta-helix repeat protein
VNVTKSINLIGENKNTTVIDGMRKCHVIFVDADDVYISGFTIQKSSLESGPFHSGIRSEEGREFICIEQNIIIDNNFGITIKYSEHCSILNNIIKSNSVSGIFGWGYDEKPCNNLTCIGNEIIKNDYGGIETIAATNCTISYNNISKNWIGIDMQWHSNNSLISNNVITNNGVYGIWHVYTGNCIIRNNTIYGSAYEEICIYEWEGDVTEGSNNTIYNNTIIGSTWDDGSGWWDNGYPSGGNYYSAYTGKDKYRGPYQNILGSDCLGDSPYNIPGGSNKDWYPLMYMWGENPPVADFTYIADNYTGLFKASSSYDLDGTVTSYDWNFGDGTSGTGMIISHTYSENGTYYVSLAVTDNDGKQGTFSRFYRTYNHAPYDPTNPNPENGSTDVDVNADLSWNCSDPDADNLTFSVYFEADDPSPDILVSDNQTSFTFDPGKMDYTTNYYWKIVAWDPYCTSTSGLIWSFTTESNAPPNQPFNPQPQDGEKGVDVNADLSWTCYDPDGDDLTYDVYFEADDSTPDELVSNNQSENWYDPGTMEYNTHYYWRIVAWDSYGGSKSGPVWDFTIESDIPGTFGNTKIESNSAWSENIIRGSWYNCPENATATSISLYCMNDGNIVHATVAFAIYSYNSENDAYQLLGQTNNHYHNFMGWHWLTLNLISPVQLNANTNYFLVFWSDATAPTFRRYDVESNKGISKYRQFTGDPFPSELTGESGIDENISIYCTYTPNYPPNTPSDPYPEDGSTGVDVNADLSWTGGDPDEGDTVFYDVYLEEDNPDPSVKVADDLVETVFDPGLLDPGTLYYWKVVARDNHFAETIGPVWHFTTVENAPPDAPSIDGPNSGKPNTEYTFTFVSTDPEGDAIMYNVDWGDGDTEWTEYGDSGAEVTLKHTWTSQGTFTIKAQAVDFYGAESDWSEFPITIPRDKAIINLLHLWFLERFPLLERLFKLI